MSSASSQTLPGASLQRSDELIDLAARPAAAAPPTSFAPLHRTVELENLYDGEQQATTPTSTKKVLTKCFTVIGDGSDKQIG